MCKLRFVWSCNILYRCMLLPQPEYFLSGAPYGGIRIIYDGVLCYLQCLIHMDVLLPPVYRAVMQHRADCTALC